MAKITKHPQDKIVFPDKPLSDRARTIGFSDSLTRSHRRALEESLNGALEQVRLLQKGELVIFGGGTLSAVETEGGVVPGITYEELLAMPSDVEFALDREFKIPKVIIPREGSQYYFGKPVDSSLFQPEHAARIAEICYAAMNDPEISRIVIAMGSDTAAYTAAAVARMLPNPSKPIVFVASMKTVGEEGSDALTNLHRGRYAANFLEPGVFLSIGKRVLDARKASKVYATEETDAFRSLGAKDTAKFVSPVSTPYILETLAIRHMPHDDLLELLIARSKLMKLWRHCKETGAEDLTSGYMVDKLSEEKVRSLVNLEDEIFDYLRENGMFRTIEELRNPPPPRLETDFDNLVMVEELWEHYKAEWLEDLLSRDDIHGMLIRGLEKLSADKRREITAVIEKHSAEKPIVVMQDPRGETSTADATAFAECVEAGGFLSNHMTIEYSSFLLKHLLARTTDVAEIKELWKDGEDIGGVGYVKDIAEPTSDEPSCTRDLEKFPELENDIRYIHLTPGFEPAWLEAILAKGDVRGLVIGGFGAGNMPTEGERDLLKILEKYKDDIPMVVVSQCESGITQANLYGPGVEATKRANVISGGIHSWKEAAAELDSLISYSLSAFNKIHVDEIRRLFRN